MSLVQPTVLPRYEGAQTHMADITQLSLVDHGSFRRQVATLDNDQARELSEFKTNRAGARDKDSNDKSPKEVRQRSTAQISQGATSSLGIGSVKGR